MAYIQKYESNIKELDYEYRLDFGDISLNIGEYCDDHYLYFNIQDVDDLNFPIDVDKKFTKPETAYKYAFKIIKKYYKEQLQKLK